MADTKLSSKVLNFSGFGDFGFTVFVNVELYYWTAFLTDKALFSLGMVAFITTFTSAIDCVWVPITGWIMQRFSPKWGKFRSWLLIGPPIMILTYAMEFSKIGSSDAIAAAIVIIGFSIKTLAQDLAYSASVSLISDLTNDPAEKVTLATRRGIFLSCGNVIFSLIGLPMITLCGNITGNEVTGYTLAALVFGIINFFIYLVPFKVTKGLSISGNAGVGYENVGEKVEEEVKEKMSVGEMLKSLVTNKPLLFLIFGDSFRYLANFLMAAAGYYYFVVVIGNLPAMTLYLTISRFAGFAGSLLAQKVIKTLGKRKAYLTTVALMAALLYACYFFGRTLVAFIVIQVIMNFAMQASMATLTVMFTDTVVYYEWKTGVDARGFIMSMLCVPIKVGALLKGLCLTAGLAAAGYVAEATEYSAATVNGVAAIMTLYPAICFTLSFIIVGLGYKITDQKVVEMTKEIEERKAAQN